MTKIPIADICLAPSSAEFRQWLAGYRRAIEIDIQGRSWLAARHMPSEAHRLEFERRRDELGEALRPASNPPPMKAIAARIGRMFLRFPASQKGDAQEITVAYARDLSVFPLWVIDQAIDRVVTGAAGPSSSMAFAPSSVELQAICREIIRPYQTEAANLRLVLTAKAAPELSDEDRALISDGFNDLRKRLGCPNRG